MVLVICKMWFLPLDERSNVSAPIRSRVILKFVFIFKNLILLLTVEVQHSIIALPQVILFIHYGKVIWSLNILMGYICKVLDSHHFLRLPVSKRATNDRCFGNLVRKTGLKLLKDPFFIQAVRLMILRICNLIRSPKDIIDDILLADPALVLRLRVYNPATRTRHRQFMTTQPCEE